MLPEKGAQVRVVDQDGNVFAYREKEDFIYEATQAFGAVAGKEYHVEITTFSGKKLPFTPHDTPSGSQYRKHHSHSSYK